MQRHREAGDEQCAVQAQVTTLTGIGQGGAAGATRPGPGALMS